MASKIKFLLPLLFSFLLVNIIASQMIPPLYFRVIKSDHKAIVVFLKRIIHLPNFTQEMSQYQAEFGSEIRTAVFGDQWQRLQLINKFEQLLAKNPKSRDLLYALYQLYHANGDQKLAGQYLNKAKAVDPAIK